MNNLLNALYQLFRGVVDSLGKGVQALIDAFGKMWWLVVSFVLVPISWVVDLGTWALQWATQQIGWLSGQVDAAGFGDIGPTFQSFGYWLGLLDYLVPVQFMFSILTILVTTWVVCIIIRVVIRAIPTAG